MSKAELAVLLDEARVELTYQQSQMRRADYLLTSDPPGIAQAEYDAVVRDHAKARLEVRRLEVELVEAKE